MTNLLRLILAILASPFKSRAELEAENVILRQQINVLCRRMPKAAGSDECRSLSVCLALSLVPLYRRGPCDRQAGDDHSLAPCWLSGLLALAIAQSRRQTESLG
jgi:hypothetical protein